MAVDKDGFFFVDGQKKDLERERKKKTEKMDLFRSRRTFFFLSKLRNLVVRIFSNQVGWHVT